MQMRINRNQAHEFYRDLCGMYNGSADKSGQCVVSSAHIADTMCMPIERANMYISAMIEYGITERTNGNIII